MQHYARSWGTSVEFDAEGRTEEPRIEVPGAAANDTVTAVARCPSRAIRIFQERDQDPNNPRALSRRQPRDAGRSCRKCLMELVEREGLKPDGAGRNVVGIIFGIISEKLIIAYYAASSNGWA